MTCDQAFDTAYDAGYFDKDEQGWSARPIRVTTRGGGLVDVEDCGHVTAYRVGRAYPATGFVALELVSGQHPSWCLFDVESRRLVSSPLSMTRQVIRTRPRAPGPPAERELLDALTACLAGTRHLSPDPASPAPAPTLADVVALLARPGDSLRLEVPGAWLSVWRRDGIVSGASSRTDSPVGQPFVAASLGEKDQTIHICAGSLDAIEPAFAATRAALGWR